MTRVRKELRGKRLGCPNCGCVGKDCHARVLVRVAREDGGVHSPVCPPCAPGSDPVESATRCVGGAATGLGLPANRVPGGVGCSLKPIGSLEPTRKPAECSEAQATQEADPRKRPDDTKLPTSKSEFQKTFPRPSPATLKAAVDYV